MSAGADQEGQTMPSVRECLEKRRDAALRAVNILKAQFLREERLASGESTSRAAVESAALSVCAAEVDYWQSECDLAEFEAKCPSSSTS